jgi:hypothetical protein
MNNIFSLNTESSSGCTDEKMARVLKFIDTYVKTKMGEFAFPDTKTHFKAIVNKSI